VKEGGEQNHFIAGFLPGLFFDPEDGGDMLLRKDGGKLATRFHAGFLPGLLFDPEDGGDMFLRNVSGKLATCFTLVSCSDYSSTLKMEATCSSETSVASLPPAFMLVSCLAYSPTLKMEATCSSEKSVNTQWTTQRYIPVDRTPHNHGCENLKS
jgi:hypothetical protein